MLWRRTRTGSSNSTTEGRASAAEPVQKMALLKHGLLLFQPSAKHLPHVARNNMVTICPGATAKLNTLDRMVHPDVLARNIAPSGLKAELPPRLMGMRSPCLPPSSESHKGKSQEDLGSGFRDLSPTHLRRKGVTWSLWCYARSAHSIERAISQKSSS